MIRLSHALILTLAAPLAAPAAIHVESHSVTVDRSRSVARFTARFDAVPDFHTVDEFDRVADSFQYEISPDPRAPVGLPPESLSSVIRGDEIRLDGTLRIRVVDFAAPDPDPAAGGWGRITAAVPFSLSDRILRFEAPLAALGDDDGHFAYRLFTTEYGVTTGEVESRLLPSDPTPAPIPLPPAFPAAAATALLLGACQLRRRPRRQRPAEEGHGGFQG
jgi:hypothetical protein